MAHSHCLLTSYTFMAINYFVQTEEKEESVWASALSCLLYFVCNRGKIRRNRLQGLDIRVRNNIPLLFFNLPVFIKILLFVSYCILQGKCFASLFVKLDRESGKKGCLLISGYGDWGVSLFGLCLKAMQNFHLRK